MFEKYDFINALIQNENNKPVLTEQVKSCLKQLAKLIPFGKINI